jgi:hypothetical protein
LDQKEDRKLLFNIVDDNGNGFLSLLEVREGMIKTMGPAFHLDFEYRWK